MRNPLPTRSPRAIVILGAALLMAGVAACDEEGDMMMPMAAGDIAVDVQSVTFADADVNLGSLEQLGVTVTNQGQGSLTVSGLALGGADADAFTLLDGSAGFTLGVGESQSIGLGFAASAVGARSGTLTISSDDPDEPTTTVSLNGSVSVFEYVQVDRKGIPALNTVFNHPSGVGPFSKVDYNRATPDNDVAAYTDLFITVLGAVGNADPAGTAALLLPDELPVSLGAQTTAFANLTGRALGDDAVDVALAVTVGISTLQSDNVDGNDRAFLTMFPYVAEAN